MSFVNSTLSSGLISTVPLSGGAETNSPFSWRVGGALVCVVTLTEVLALPSLTSSFTTPVSATTVFAWNNAMVIFKIKLILQLPV